MKVKFQTKSGVLSIETLNKKGYFSLFTKEGETFHLHGDQETSPPSLQVGDIRYYADGSVQHSDEYSECYGERR